MIFKKLIGFCFVFWCLLPFVLSLNVNLNSQTPSSVEPGQIFYIELGVSLNSSNDKSIKNVEVEFLENENFRIDKDLNKFQTIPIIENGQNINIRYKLISSSNLDSGLNTISFRVNNGYNNLVYDFDVLVQDLSPKIQVNKFSSTSSIPGEYANLNIEIENINSVSLKDIFIELNIEQIEDQIIKLKNTTNTFFLPNLGANSKYEFKLPILISPEATSKPYNIPINISYKDELNNEFSLGAYGSLNVEFPENLLIKINEIGINSVEIAIANPSLSIIKGLTIDSIIENSQISKGSFNYIGDLNPDDFQTIIIDYSLEDEKSNEVNLELDLNYYNSYNKKINKEVNFNFQNKKQEESNSFFLVVAFLVILGIGYFYYRKYKRNSKK